MSQVANGTTVDEGNGWFHTFRIRIHLPGPISGSVGRRQARCQ
jgi:hypothetical protein